MYELPQLTFRQQQLAVACFVAFLTSLLLIQQVIKNYQRRKEENKFFVNEKYYVEHD